jgi:hypothetical protein
MKFADYLVVALTIAVATALGLTIWAFNENPNAYGVMTDEQREEYHEMKEVIDHSREQDAASIHKELGGWQTEQARNITPSGVPANPPGP